MRSINYESTARIAAGTDGMYLRAMVAATPAVVWTVFSIVSLQLYAQTLTRVTIVLAVITTGAVAACYRRALQADGARSWGNVAGIFEWAEQAFYWVVPALWLLSVVIIAAYAVNEGDPRIPNPAVWVIVLLAIILAVALAHAKRTGTAGAAIILGLLGVLILGAVIFLSMLSLAYQNRRAAPATPAVVYELGPDNLPVATQPDPRIYFLPDDTQPANSTPAQMGGIQTSSSAGSSEFQFQYHTPGRPQRTPHTFSAPGMQYVQAENTLALVTLPLFQFLAALRPGDDQKRRRGKPAVVATLLVITWCGSGVVAWFVKLWTAWFSQAMANDSLPTGGPAPIGDALQLFGAAMLGSPRAGWWLMMTAVLLMLFVLCAAAWASFAAGPDIFPIGGDSRARTASRRYPRIYLRAAVTGGLSAISVLCLFVWESAIPQPFSRGPAFGSRYFGSVSRFPDLSSTLSLCVVLAFLLLCAAVCVAGSKTPGIRKVGIIGLLGCLALLALFVTAAIASPSPIAKPFFGAATLCMIWIMAAMFSRSIRNNREWP